MRHVHVPAAVALASLLSAPAAGQGAVYDSYVKAADKAIGANDLASAEKFLTLAEREAGDDKDKLANVWTKQSYLADRRFQYAESEALLKKVQTYIETLKDRSRLARALTSLANHYRLCDQNESAEPLYKRALALREKANGHKAWETGQLLREYADFQCSLGRLDVAEPLYRRAIDVLTPLKERAYHLANALAGLAETRLRLDSPEEAEALARRALELFEHLEGPPPASGTAYVQSVAYGILGDALNRRKKVGEAAEAFSKAVKFLDDASVAPAQMRPLLRRIAAFYRENGRTAEANKLEERARAIDEQHERAKKAIAG